MRGIEEAMVFGDAEQLPNFGPPFMAHAPASAAAMLAPLTRSNGIGAVITTRNASEARKAIRRILLTNPRAAILADADRYSGKNRGIGASCMTAAWVNMQLKAGLPWALTDSGYIPAGDVAALRAVLAWAARVDPGHHRAPTGDRVVDPRSRHPHRRADRRGTPRCVDARVRDRSARDQGRGDRADCGAALPVAVLLLRSDTSVLGALAHGAAAVSVGTKSGLRHIYPIPDDDSGGFAPPPAAYVPALQSYYRLAPKIEDAITRNPSLDIWTCDCTACHGRSLAWIVFNTDPPTATFEHSLAAQADVARTILSYPPAARGSEWKTMCAQAQLNHDRVVTTKNKTWQPAKALKAWVSSTPQPQASAP